jgi:uncharacterized SAM-binding protein YcdF (DUF218 family)
MVFRYFFKGMLLPPFIQIIAILVAWRLRKRRPKIAWGVCIFAVLSLWILGTPVAATFLSRTLERHRVLVPDQLHAIDADAIVILSARQIDSAPEYGRPVSSYEMLSRVRYGAFIHRKTGLPILLSGGSLVDFERRSLAETMAYDLFESFNVDAGWLETRSKTTMENALYSYDILAAKDKTSIVLVTTAYHMMRAKWSFEQAGFDVLAAPTGLADVRPLTLLSFIPESQSLHLSRLALHEWLGYIIYRVFSYIMHPL